MDCQKGYKVLFHRRIGIWLHTEMPNKKMVLMLSEVWIVTLLEKVKT